MKNCGQTNLFEHLWDIDTKQLAEVSILCKKKKRESKQLSSLLNKLVCTEKFAENNNGVRKTTLKKCKFIKNFIN